MNITPLSLQESATAFGTGDYTTGAFTTLDDSLLAIFVEGIDAVGNGGIESLVNVSSSPALTWTKVVFQDGSNWGYGGGWYVAPVTTGASTTVTIANGTGRAMHRWRVQPICLTGYDAGTPTGATAETITGTDGAQSVTLSGAPAASSYILAARVALMNNGTASATPGSGWTEVCDASSTDYEALQIQYITGSTSTTVPWVDVNTGAGTIDQEILIAIEVRSAAGGTPGDAEGAGATATASAAVATAAAITATIIQRLISKTGAAQASITGITALIYKSVPSTTVAPDKVITALSTNGSGNLNINVSDIGLSIGDPVWLILMKDGSPPLATAVKATPSYS